MLTQKEQLVGERHERAVGGPVARDAHGLADVAAGGEALEEARAVDQADVGEVDELEVLLVAHVLQVRDRSVKQNLIEHAKLNKSI